MAAAAFLLFMVSIAIFGMVFVTLTLRHHRQVAQGQTAAAKSLLVKPPENS